MQSTSSRENYYLDSQKFTEVDSGKSTLRRNKLKILLLVILIFLILAVIGLIAFIIVREVTRPKPAADETCTTPACVEAAANVIRHMDQTVDPCTDFYNFSCGQFMRDSAVSDASPSKGTFTEMREKLNMILKNLLEGEIDTSDVPTFEKAKMLYESCLTYMNPQALTSTKPLLGPIFELLPVPFISNSWPPNSVEEYIGKLKAYSIGNPLINFGLGVDEKNSSLYYLGIAPPTPLLSVEYYHNSEIMHAYKGVLTQVLTKLYVDFNVTKTPLEIHVMVETAIAMETIVAQSYQSENNTGNNVQYLTDNAPKINWTLLLNSYYDGSGVTVNNDTKVKIFQSDYLVQANIMAHNYTLEDFGILPTIYILVNYIKYLPASYRSIYQQLTGPNNDPTWSTCLSYVQEALTDTLDKGYAQKYFDLKSKNEVTEMTEGLRLAFINQLETNEWMDPDTKRVAREKALAIKANIAYPDYVMNNQRLEERMKTYHMTSNFPTNVYNITMNLHEKELIKMRGYVDKKEWITRAAIVNAFYYATYNQIYVPVGILKEPFFNVNRPQYMNYAYTGTVVGHEITHGFDDYGRLRDKDGNLREWWSSQAINKFNAQAQCFIDQYGNYTVQITPPTNINGQLTLGENIADNGGIKQSFEAYNTWKRKKNQNRSEKKLPGLPYSPEQLFFIGFGQIWCTKTTDAMAAYLLRSDSHSPGRFRVIGTLSNSKEFAATFNCPLNSPMNPSKKCIVW